MAAAHSLVAALDEIDRLSDQAPRRERLELRCKTLITLALTELLLSGVEAAMTRLSEAEVIVDELADGALRARLNYQRANIHGRVGDLASAWDGLEAAAGQLDAFTPHEQCSVHLSRGMLAFELFRPQAALESFAEAARLAHALGGLEQEFMARHNEGYAAYLLGDLPRSLAGMAAAERLDADVFRAPSRLDRGRVLLEAGLVREAIDTLEVGVAELSGEGHEQARAEFDLELARAQRLLGHLDRSAEAADASRVTYERIGATAWAAKATLVGLMVDLAKQRASAQSPAPAAAPAARATGTSPGAAARTEAAATPTVAAAPSVVARQATPARQARAAADRADALIETATENGDAELADAARVVSGEALLLGGDVDGARTRLLGLERVSTGSLSDELDSAAVTAEVFVAAGEVTAARRLLSRAAKRLAAGQEGSASLDLRTARAVHGVRLAAIDLDLAVPRGSPSVIETLERWRSATDRLPSLGRPTDDELASLTETLRSVRAQMRGAPEPEQLRELQARAARLERQIRDRDWALSSQTRSGSAMPMRVREARAALDAADRDLVWLFAHRQRLCGVGVIGGRAAVRDLMPLAEAAELSRRVRVDLRAAATHHLGPLAGAVWGSLRSSVDRLDAAIVRPWSSSRGGLVLVTCEELSALPWALLPSMHARPLTIAASLTSFSRREQPAAAASGARHRAGSAAAGPRSVHVSVGPHLTRAVEEAGAVAATWERVGHQVDVATPSRTRELVEALAHEGVVHVAAHGTHQVESPLFSSLSLHDGPLFAHELQPSGVRADHVVLSACDVGSATFRPGDEQLGLAAAVLSLGARSVVAAVSPVPDDVAAAAMTAHHEALAAGAPSDEALAQAISVTDPVAASFLNLGGRFTP